VIIASAIRLPNGSFFVGKRHGDCYLNMKKILHLDKPNETTVKSEQGFINHKLQFLTREEAYMEAVENKQCEKKSYCWLASEDLW
jgi:hypothetical protein